MDIGQKMKENVLSKDSRDILGDTVKVLKEKGYRILFLAGNGATGKVYCVKEEKTGKNYACKVSRQNLLLHEEACFMCRLKHPLFPVWHDLIEKEETSYLLMEYIAGSGLDHMIRRRGCFSERETARIAIELASGLACLHEGHPAACYRDLKPANVMIQQNGSVRLVDLGTVCVMEPGSLAVSFGGSLQVNQVSPVRAGTIGFAPPEQWREGHVLDGRTDIYALGVLMHYMATGCGPNPDSGSTLAAPKRHFRNKRPGYGLMDIIQSCTLEKPEERLPSMREVIKLLSPYYSYEKHPVFMEKWYCLSNTDRTKFPVYVKSIWKTSRADIQKHGGKLQ